jgi:DNA-directed RNA polymerase subunit alpha
MKNLILSCLESRVEDDGVMYGRFLFGPAPRGLAVTIATALRRSLLSEVAGFAITHVEFIGVKHEYSTLPGTQETVLDVMLNLKKLIFTSTTKVRRKAVGYCSGRGPGVLTGRDLKLPPGVQCTNPDQVIAHLANDGHLSFSCIISTGKNYVIQRGTLTRRGLRAQRKRQQSQPVVTRGNNQKPTSVFSIDAVFMPVLRVNYLIQSDEDVLEFPLRYNSLEVSERLVFEIWTNGNVTPREAIHQASTQLIRLFSLFQKSREPSELRMLYRARAHKEQMKLLKYVMLHSDHRHVLQSLPPNHYLAIDIGILPISPSLFVTLKKRNIDRLGDFLDFTYDDLSKISGMTTEVLFEVLCSLRSYGIRFLPDIRRDKYMSPFE